MRECCVEVEILVFIFILILHEFVLVDFLQIGFHLEVTFSESTLVYVEIFDGRYFFSGHGLQFVFCVDDLRTGVFEREATGCKVRNAVEIGAVVITAVALVHEFSEVSDFN